jgi:hypothetical protein
MNPSKRMTRAQRTLAEKQKQEQNKLIAKGLGSAGLELNKRVGMSGNIIQTNEHKVKYSQLLSSFVTPYLDYNDSISDLKVKFTQAANAWNSAILNELNEEEFATIQPKTENLRINPLVLTPHDLMTDFLKRKTAKFAGFNDLFVDFEIAKLENGDYDVTVVTISLSDL